MRTRWVSMLAVLVGGCLSAAVVDRIAVVVGKTVITESEVLEEVRLTEFMNQEPLDLGPEQRRAAADRLVDQQLIRNELEIGNYPQPTESEADEMLRKFRQEHYASIPQFRAALEKYGLTEDQLKQHLRWQLAAMRFTDLRFSAGLPPPVAEGTANRAAPGVEPASKKPDRATAGANRSSGANRMAPGSETASTNGGNVDQQMDAWLRQARSSTRIQFKKDAFQ